MPPSPEPPDELSEDFEDEETELLEAEREELGKKILGYAED